MFDEMNTYIWTDGLDNYDLMVWFEMYASMAKIFINITSDDLSSTLSWLRNKENMLFLV